MKADRFAKFTIEGDMIRMKMIWIYIRALGLVFSRRFKRGMENKKNVMIMLGTVATLLVCLGGGYLVHTLSAMNALRTSKQEAAMLGHNEEDYNLQEADATEMIEAMQIEQNNSDEIAISEEAMVADIQNLAEEQVPLTMEPGTEEFAQRDKWIKIEPSKSNASSVLQSKSGKSYDASNLLDDNRETTWQEGEEGDGIGVSLAFQFDKDTNICGFSFVNGNATSVEKYQDNNRIKDITVMIDQQEVIYTLIDQAEVQYIAFDEMVPCTDLTIRIDSVYEGSKYDDTTASDICFYTINS